MTNPISPPAVTGGGRNELPAYVSNGIIGLKVRDNPLMAGKALVNGYSGHHPVRRIEAAASAPYPVAGDICVNGVWLSDAPQNVHSVDQAYDFATGELTSRLTFTVCECNVRIHVVTFCSREQPTIVCQEVTAEVDAACDLNIRAEVNVAGVEGRPLQHFRESPVLATSAVDGVLLWESAGGYAKCGVAYHTELIGADQNPEKPPLSGAGLFSAYAFRANPGRRYRLRSIASVLPSALHRQPDLQAARLLGYAVDIGFDALWNANRGCWAELWKGRICLQGASRRWQGLADAAFFYLLTSVHHSAPASTSIFGLASWPNYHYYYGHVMWDIETFCVPPLVFLQPDAAEAILDYRHRNLQSAKRNAQLRGRRGLQFPWESSPSCAEEEAPIPATASWREDHVSLDIAHAFALFSNVTGDERFLLEKAWPVLAGVSEWIKSRVTRGENGFEILNSEGIAERGEAVNNPAFTNMSASLVLRDACLVAERLGLASDSLWPKIAAEIVLPKQDDIVVSHDGYRKDQSKGATPDPLTGIFPLNFPLEQKTKEETLSFYLNQADDYIGSPMLSALYGVWAAHAGDRSLSLELLEEGYGRFISGRFLQTLEYREDKFPEEPRAGPFFANLGGFLMSLILGFPRINPNAGRPSTWTSGPIVLPAGWNSIEIDRLWIRGQPWRLSAVHGAERATLEPLADSEPDRVS